MKLRFLLFLLLPAITSAGEILIYDGIRVSSPGLAIVGPGKSEPPDLIFIKQFFADEKTLARPAFDPKTNTLTTITATDAIELALATVHKPEGRDGFRVTKLELLDPPAHKPEIGSFYLITISVSGSEEHRIVLNNKAVIKPRLKRVK